MATTASLAALAAARYLRERRVAFGVLAPATFLGRPGGRVLGGVLGPATFLRGEVPVDAAGERRTDEMSSGSPRRGGEKQEEDVLI